MPTWCKYKYYQIVAQSSTAEAPKQKRERAARKRKVRHKSVLCGVNLGVLSFVVYNFSPFIFHFILVIHTFTYFLPSPSNYCYKLAKKIVSAFYNSFSLSFFFTLFSLFSILFCLFFLFVIVYFLILCVWFPVIIIFVI